MPVWDTFLTDQDRRVYELSGWGRRGGFGSRPALLVVDFTVSFIGDTELPVLESMKRWRRSCGSVGWSAIGPTADVISAARGSRVPIFYTRGCDERPDGFDQGAWAFKNDRTREDRPHDGRAAGGNEIVPRLAPQAHDVVIEKLKPSAFFGTALTGFLVDLAVDTLIVCGTTTSGCVRATVIDAFNLNYRVAVVEECTFDRFESSHAMTLFDLNAKYGDVVSVGEACSYLSGVQPGMYDASIGFPASG
jgi:maleamate amidohydrolase